MDYGRADRTDRLAAEYVLGTLRGGARRRFEALLPAHPAMRAAVYRWQNALMPLTLGAAPVQPSPAVWAAVQRRLFTRPGDAQAAAADDAPWWQRVLAWRVLTGMASAAALVLAVLLTLPAEPQAPLMIVLASSDAAQGAVGMPARFVASISADGRGLVLKPVDAVPVAADRSLELWALPERGAPRSLGVLSQQQTTRVYRASLLRGNTGFAISLEPQGGSPTGAPTGPILSVGKLDT